MIKKVAMVDKVKMYLTNVKIKSIVSDDWKYFKKTDSHWYFKRKLKNPRSILGGNYSLILIAVIDEDNSKTCCLTIRGSLRKWYFGRNCRRDLTVNELAECTKLLSAALRLAPVQILDAQINQIEFGVTLTLPAEYRKLQDCLYFYPRLSRNQYNTTLYFGDKTKSSYNLILYDKYEEIFKNRNNKDNMYKANQKIYFMRYEISVNKLSSVPFFRERAQTLRMILWGYWNEIGNHLLATFDKIKYVDFTSEPGKEIACYQDVNKLIMYNGIVKEGLSYYIEKINSSKISNKSHLFSSILSVAEYFNSENENYKHTAYSVLSKKITRLSYQSYVIENYKIKRNQNENV